MAWSDAARAAALEARRMHGFAKKHTGGRMPIIGNAILKSRPQIAADLRAIRSGVGFKSTASKMAVHEMAVYASNQKRANVRGSAQERNSYNRDLKLRIMNGRVGRK